MFRVFFIFLLSFSLNAKEYPKTFAALSTPIFSSVEVLGKCEDLKGMKDIVKNFQKRATEVKKYGFDIDKTDDAVLKKRYLKKLRELKKEYDYIVYLISRCIDKSIDENNYKILQKLLSLELEGVLKDYRLRKKLFLYYEKNKNRLKSKVVQDGLEREKLMLLTQEMFSQIQSMSFSSNESKFDTNASVIIYAKRQDNIIDVFFKNKNIFDVTLKVEKRYENLDASVEVKDIFVLKANDTKKFVRLYIKKDDFSYSFKYKWTMGSIYAKHDEKYVYSLPYPKGKSFVLSQGFNSSLSHKGRAKYALDFAMPVGSKVCAARGGIVLKSVAYNGRGGFDKRFRGRGNYLIIGHDDGTFGLYYHLKKDGVVVKVGSRVKRCQHIAYSGNSGYSSGPHLHFAVYKTTKELYSQTIKIKFISTDGVVTNPHVNHVYTAL